MSHTIELRKVSKYYAGEDTVSMGFSRIDLNLDIGEFVAITGESGSGKSTLLNVISGLDTYEEGEMFVCGEDTTAYSTEDYEIYRKTYIGNIFQDFNLINSYTVYQNIEAVMLLCGKKKRDCKQRILELLELVGLSQYRRTKVSKLSGGQKQRVAIARALAKDAPIIVADEPTGNLDSASAATVMETLSKVSADKLVVIVTHNYDQAEPYVTRKLTMHDGKIIEDKTIAPADYEVYSESGIDYTAYDANNAHADLDPSSETVRRRDGRAARAEKAAKDAEAGKLSRHGEVVKPRKMRKGAEIRLGLRNTFNIPAKFILLFIVYFFVSTAVLSQYATTKSSMHENDLLGGNPYFINSSSDRVIVKKADESSFSEDDLNAVLSTPNVRSIVKNDIALDSGVSFVLGEAYIEGPVMPVGELEDAELTYGHMPETEYDIVIKMDYSSDALYSIGDNGDAYIDKTVKLSDMSQMQTYQFDKDIRVAGIIIDETENESDYSMYGYSTIYASDTVSNELLVSMMAASSKTEMNFGGTKVRNEYEKSVYSSPKVPDGKVYLFEDQTFYYNEGEAVGKDFSLRIWNRFFESQGKYTVDKIITAKNCDDLVGIPREEYDMYYNCVFISDHDFKALFDKGFFQISAYMEAEQDSDETIKSLNEQGFTTLALKDSLTDMTGGFDVVISLMAYGRLLVELIILFFIAYAVIRLIMRSRNSYYSTLRILGATKGNTDSILRVELILMMVIAYGLDLAFVFLVKSGILQNALGADLTSVNNMLYFLTTVDYVALGILLLLMSLLIANRYSRRIFTRSAMKTFREGA